MVKVRPWRTYNHEVPQTGTALRDNLIIKTNPLTIINTMSLNQSMSIINDIIQSIIVIIQSIIVIIQSIIVIIQSMNEVINHQ